MTSGKILGIGLFVMKEKLKKLKSDIKKWNREVFGIANHIGECLERRLSKLDGKDDESTLSDEGREERKLF